MLLCDVAREAASIVLADLRSSAWSADGSIAVEQLDTLLSERASSGRARGGDPANAVVWEQVEARIDGRSSSRRPSLHGPVDADRRGRDLPRHPILIIGAMVLGPEFGPLASFCVAVVERRPRLALRSLVALVAGFPVAIARRLPGVADLQVDRPHAGRFQPDGSQLGGDHREPGLLLVLRRVHRGRGRRAVPDDREVRRAGRRADLGHDDSGGRQHRRRGRVSGLVGVARVAWSNSRSTSARSSPPAAPSLYLQRWLYRRRRARHLSDPERHAGLSTPSGSRVTARSRPSS